MAETDIAIDIASSASDSSGIHQHRASPLAARSRLTRRTLILIGLEASVTPLAGWFSLTLLHAQRSVGAANALLAATLLVACQIATFLGHDLYGPRTISTRLIPLGRLLLAWLQSVALSVLALLCLDALDTLPHPGTAAMQGLPAGMVRPGAWLPILVLTGFIALVATRRLWLRFAGDPIPANRTVIVGEPTRIHHILNQLRTASHPAFDVVGLVEQPNETRATPHRFGLPLIRDIDLLERAIQRDVIDSVIIAMPWNDTGRLRAIADRIAMSPVDVYVYPGMDGLSLPRGPRTRRSTLPLLLASARPMTGSSALLKRAEDIILSLGLLLFISPVLLTIAAAIKLTSRGPVFFRQRRLGYNNRVIEVLKFRTMYTHLSDQDAVLQTFRGDKRVTPLGAWLRRTSLDELPQLFNVLRGDMSLVGPRPHALATTAGGLALEEAVPAYCSRHRVKPGITGWAQVNGCRGALDKVEKIVHRVNYDLYYIENWSLALDLKILWRTAWLVFADDNAF